MGLRPSRKPFPAAVRHFRPRAGCGYVIRLAYTGVMPAVIEMESGHAVCAMGSAAEVEAALCDELLYDSDGWVLLRFAYEPACFSVDPSKVVGVYEATVCDFPEAG
jgi:hypothetical protein